MLSYIFQKSNLLIYKLFFFFSAYFTSTLLFLTYDISLSPDFAKYFKYFEFYSSQIEVSGKEQGNLYFFTAYIFSYLIQIFNGQYEIIQNLNISLHFFNSLLFLIGLLGLIKYLIGLGYSKKIVFLTGTVVCFLPISTAMRLTFKPEILAFTFLCWMLFDFNKLKEVSFLYQSKYQINFIRFFIFLGLSLSLKISISAMFALFFGLKFFTIKRKLKITKQLIALFLLFCTLLNLESFLLNQKFFSDVTHTEKYNNEAPLSFFTNINYEHLKNNPNRYFHSDSFISITLFDSFNDFFLLYGNSEYTELNLDRKNFFNTISQTDKSIPPKVKFDKNNNIITFYANFDERWIDPNYVDETRFRFSFIFSTIFYFLITFFSFIRKDLKVELLSPFIGIILVIISSAGLFGVQNFDPSVGDSAKTFYYCFFIIISFSMLLPEILNKIKYFYKTISVILIVLFLFFTGMPSDYTNETKALLESKNSTIITCDINNIIFSSYLFSENSNCDYEDNYLYLSTRTYENFKFSLNYMVIPYLSLGSIIFLFFYQYLHKKEKLKKSI